MLFIAEYELTWEMLEAAMAKRLEWPNVQPDDFRFIGEYVWQEREPPFRGIAIIEAKSVDALNSFALHYGPTLKLCVHPASDVVSAIALLDGSAGPRRHRDSAPAGKPRRKSKRR